MADRVGQWVAENDDLIAQGVDRFVEGLVPALGTVVEIGSDVVAVMGDVTDALGGTENALTVAAVASAGSTLPVSIAEAIEGAKVDVPTPWGTIALKVPAGTSGGRKLRAAGMGVRHANGAKGDLIAEVQIVLPDMADAAARVSGVLGVCVTSTGTGFHLSSGSGAMVSTAVTAPASSSFSAKRVVMPVHCAPG
jgi:hypothetical protein